MVPWSQRKPDEREPGITRRGWQHDAASRVEQRFREVEILPRFAVDEKVMLRSQSGHGAGVALSAVLSCDVFRLAFILTLLATVVQCAAELGCWAGEGLH